ncbi:hypothetical protein P4T54_24950 [Bacillus mycoides]|uniref:hypothetical protein n=1 Tax=Bacillus mycoides TaxID=1405 RepID=UPI002E1DF91E|nr:hypothetical protein [Bacillus mycoides]MED1047667.1 hypothetical protein [Bacillus mycoides]MED1054404.1 hypothetical protein [Bacillus mycoides]MED1086938.1 hypothetical protein [Bacillus mycoides]
MKDVKIEYVEEWAKIFVEGKEIACATNGMAKAVLESLLVSLDQAGAINLSIEN